MTKEKLAAISKKTERNTKWCMNIWKDWSIQINSPESSEVRQEVTTLEPAQLQKCLSRFVLEIRKDGTPYPPDSVYHIVGGVMWYIRLNGKPEIYFFKDKTFAEFRSVLDAEMKSAGMGSRVHKAEPIIPQEEDLLW